MPSIAILGASAQRTKFGNRAVRAYQGQGWTVYPIHPTETEIEGLRVFASIKDVPGPLDRASLYLPPHIGITLLADIAAIGAKQLWVNPGSGDEALIAKAESLGLNVIEACSLLAAY